MQYWVLMLSLRGKKDLKLISLFYSWIGGRSVNRLPLGWVFFSKGICDKFLSFLHANMDAYRSSLAYFENTFFACCFSSFTNVIPYFIANLCYLKEWELCKMQARSSEEMGLLTLQ